MINFLFISSVYVLCELIKTLSFNERVWEYGWCMKRINNNEFPTCGKVGLSEEVCANQWGVSTLSSFTYGLPISLVIIHTLYGDVMKRFINYPYWIVVHVSVVLFSYTQKISEFNFSIDSDASYNNTDICILLLIGIVSCCIIFRNLIFKNVSRDYLLMYGLMYMFILVSFWTRTHEIKFHIHHSLLCTFLSYFVTDWSSKINEYIHGILLGITIQGISFYNFDEFHLFYIPYDIYPVMHHITFLYITLILTSIATFVYKKRRIYEEISDTSSVNSSSELLESIPENGEVNV